MNQTVLLQYLVNRIEKAGIPFMVSGSVASGYHGKPRATYGIDIIIEANDQQIQQLTIGLADR